MKWYDYVVCIVAADAISAGIIHQQWSLIVLGIVQYFAWELHRKYISP